MLGLFPPFRNTLKKKQTVCAPFFSMAECYCLVLTPLGFALTELSMNRG